MLVKFALACEELRQDGSENKPSFSLTYWFQGSQSDKSIWPDQINSTTV